MGDSFYKWKKRTNRECMKSEKQIFTFRWKCESERETHTQRAWEPPHLIRDSGVYGNVALATF